jgi:LmbE family N-acetylglucosaminyl deacetylase
MKISVVCVLLLCLAGLGLQPARAQVQELKEDLGAAGAYQALLRARSTATVLFTQAHPDDEDAALVTLVARRDGARTGLLSLTRGEGGANLIGPEQYDALGVLRTEEFLAACRYYGVRDLMFTRAADFGFSKRLDETLEHWGKDAVLSDVVRAIRAYRPDIIISRFHGAARDGHGNHQAAGLLTREAFKLAADPQAFPDQLRDGLRPWQAKKLYFICRPNEAHTLKLNTGVYDPLLGRTYREMASEGYAMHRSQAVGTAKPPRGQSFSYLRLVESVGPQAASEQSIYDGLTLDTSGVAAEVARLEAGALAEAEQSVREFDARRPWAVVPRLVAGAKQVQQALIRLGQERIPIPVKSEEELNRDPLRGRLTLRAEAFNEAVNKALSLTFDVLVDPANPPSGPFAMMQPRETFAVAIPGQQFSITATVTNRSGVAVKPGAYGFLLPPGISTALDSDPHPTFADGAYTFRSRVTVGERVEFSQPLWSRASELRDHLYRYPFKSDFIPPYGDRTAQAGFNYSIDGVPFQIDAPLQTSFVAAPYGERRRLLTVAPAMNVSLAPRVGVVPLGSSSTTANVTVSVASNAKGKAEGKVKLRAPEGWRVEPSEQPFSFEHEDERRSFSFKVTIPSVKPNADYKLQAVAEYAGREYSEGYQVIAHRDLEPRHLYRDAVMTIRGMGVKVAPNLSVGYVMGVGDKVPEALEQIGVKVTMLGANELASGNLDQFEAIIVGIRASAVRDDLKAHNRRLLDYVERGGNLIWQYQTPEFDQLAYGPYPYKMGRNPEEVSEEEAKVTILDPANAVFNWPNKITEADFNGWVEERGSKWLAEWDTRYTPLLEAHDRGQAPQRGGLLQAKYGRGTFTYAAYAFYRQLPAGVEGAYRLFANLVSLKRRGE